MLRLEFTVTVEHAQNTIVLEDANIVAKKFGQTKFVCSYPMEVQVASEAYEVNDVTISGQHTSTGSLTDGFSMLLNKGNKSPVLLGKVLTVEVNWTVSLLGVTFYPKKCTIQHGGVDVDLISGGCLSNALQVTKIGQYDTTKYIFEYKTFQVDGAVGNEQQMNCVVKLCLNNCDNPKTDESCPSDLEAFEYTVDGYKKDEKKDDKKDKKDEKKNDKNDKKDEKEEKKDDKKDEKDEKKDEKKDKKDEKKDDKMDEKDEKKDVKKDNKDEKIEKNEKDKNDGK